VSTEVSKPIKNLFKKLTRHSTMTGRKKRSTRKISSYFDELEIQIDDDPSSGNSRRRQEQDAMDTLLNMEDENPEFQDQDIMNPYSRLYKQEPPSVPPKKIRPSTAVLPGGKIPKWGQRQPTEKFQPGHTTENPSINSRRELFAKPQIGRKKSFENIAEVKETKKPQKWLRLFDSDRDIKGGITGPFDGILPSQHRIASTYQPKHHERVTSSNDFIENWQHSGTACEMNYVRPRTAKSTVNKVLVYRASQGQ
jgi:hypothetical protein